MFAAGQRIASGGQTDAEDMQHLAVGEGQGGLNDVTCAPAELGIGSEVDRMRRFVGGDCVVWSGA